MDALYVYKPTVYRSSNGQLAMDLKFRVAGLSGYLGIREDSYVVAYDDLGGKSMSGQIDIWGGVFITNFHIRVSRHITPSKAEAVHYSHDTLLPIAKYMYSYTTNSCDKIRHDPQWDFIGPVELWKRLKPHIIRVINTVREQQIKVPKDLTFSKYIPFEMV
jgi:hypothetical protein